ncbi:acyl carrier protein [Maridesulfovibrio ferrireducens]|uniref:Acyl carrier protein n=1 Tax=Maridesulfovibrio ferrireducens TaxID=246191 RepID=A0A1G9CMH2_9BACT|nr:phosphopantetheine-binding protein [Maridesulfovibrio ferrireducens]SDK52766.1 acyl carrier protein [Maridesulfovibrio ferrireducens]
MFDKVKTVLSQMTGCPVDKIQKDTAIKSLEGWDSLKHIKIVLAIEEAFDTVFTGSEIEKLTDVKSILETLQQRG